jgi:ATP-binding cassette subfamily G (WHITE) protein 2 (SNQ2)
MKLHLRTFPDAIKEFFLSPLFIIGPKFGLFQPTPKKILQGFNGVVRPGEMVLVLGRPGSGCSTFLKTIANQRDGYLAVNGEVTYAGMEAVEFGKRFSGEVVYNAEGDQHYATLTVEQTLEFALATKSDSYPTCSHLFDLIVFTQLLASVSQASRRTNSGRPSLRHC